MTGDQPHASPIRCIFRKYQLGKGSLQRAASNDRFPAMSKKLVFSHEIPSMLKRDSAAARCQGFAAVLWVV